MPNDRRTPGARQKKRAAKNKLRRPPFAWERASPNSDRHAVDKFFDLLGDASMSLNDFVKGNHARHLARLALMERVDRKAAEFRRKDAVGGTGRSSALNVAEHDVSHFKRAALLFEGRHDFGGSAQRIPFRDDHNNRAFSKRLESPQVGDDPFDRGGRLRNRDDFAPARERDVRREIPAMPAHNFDEKHHVVAAGGVAQLIDRVDAGLNGGRESDRIVGAEQVVVDRAGQPNNLPVPEAQ